MLSAGGWYHDAGQIADTPSLYLAPAEMNSKPLYAVERMFGMDGAQRRYIPSVFGVLPGRRPVVMRPAKPEYAGKMFPPSRFDFLQDG